MSKEEILVEDINKKWGLLTPELNVLFEAQEVVWAEIAKITNNQ